MFSLQRSQDLSRQNKQTTALTQLQMKANLYAINKRRSSFNLPVRPAHCSPPPFLYLLLQSTHSSHPPCVLPYLSPCCVLLGWAQRQGKLTDASIIHRSPLLFCFFPLAFSAVLCVFKVPYQSLYGGEFGDGKMRCSGWSFWCVCSQTSVLKGEEENEIGAELLCVPLTHLLFDIIQRGLLRKDFLFSVSHRVVPEHGLSFSPSVFYPALSGSSKVIVLMSNFSLCIQAQSQSVSVFLACIVSPS